MAGYDPKVVRVDFEQFKKKFSEMTIALSIIADDFRPVVGAARADDRPPARKRSSPEQRRVAEQMNFIMVGRQNISDAIKQLERYIDLDLMNINEQTGRYETATIETVEMRRPYTETSDDWK